MNYYELKIEGGDAAIEIVDSQKSNHISAIEIEFYTAEKHTREKSNAMTAHIVVKGRIRREISKQLKAIFEWSKDFVKATTYRKVTVVIKDDAETTARTYSFDQMFVSDYKETYGGEDDNSDVGGTFELLMTQRERNLDSAEVILA